MANQKIQRYEVKDVLFERISDNLDRNYVSYGTDDKGIGQTYTAENRGRISQLQMVGSDGTTTIDIKINGQPQWGAFGGQPSAEGLSYDNPSGYKYQRGDIIEIYVVSGTATGRVVMDTENHELIKRADVVTESARQRLKRESQRRSYDPTPQGQHFLQERFGSFAEAAQQQSGRGTITEAATATTTATSGHNLGGTQHGTGSGGYQNLPGPNYPHPGGGTGGGHKPGGGGSHGGHR